MKLLDANVVIYSLGREHPYREPCRAIINQSERRSHDYAVNAEMPQEILNVFWNKRDIEMGIEVVNRLLSLFPNPIPITGAEVALATQLIGQVQRLSARDAIHVAVVMIHGLEGIVSTDKDFDHVPGLRRYDPLDMAVGM